MPIFRVKSVKIYTGQKKFTRTPSARPWQIWGMCTMYNGMYNVTIFWHDNGRINPAVQRYCNHGDRKMFWLPYKNRWTWSDSISWQNYWRKRWFSIVFFVWLKMDTFTKFQWKWRLLWPYPRGHWGKVKCSRIVGKQTSKKRWMCCCLFGWAQIEWSIMDHPY